VDPTIKVEDKEFKLGIRSFKDVRRDRQKRLQRKNPIELRREQEGREAARKREKEAELEKQKRKENYKKKVKSVEAKPSKKKVKKSIVRRPLHDEQPQERPSTIVSKFRKWLFRG
jgi:hypothetical protein